MIKHLFRLIWNRKKSNFLMSVGIFFSFVVLFFVLALSIHTLINYTKPLGFDYKDVSYISMDWKNTPKEQIHQTLKQFEYELKTIPEIVEFTYSKCYLLIPSATSNSIFNYKDKNVRCDRFHVGDSYPEVMRTQTIKGRWFSKEDNGLDGIPIIINKYTHKNLFNNEPVLGTIVTMSEIKYKIIGIIDEFRHGGELTSSRNVILYRLHLDYTRGFNEFTREGFFSRILLRLKPGSSIEIEENILSKISSIAPDWTLRVNSFEELKKTSVAQSLALPITLAIICLVLVFNVALGLFGITWYTTNKRRSEIGLRRALGATSKVIYKQILGESLTLSTFAIIFGSLFVMQFPMLNLISMFNKTDYTFAYVASIIFVYLLTSICALYPSRIAAKVQPSEALHYE